MDEKPNTRRSWAAFIINVLTALGLVFLAAVALLFLSVWVTDARHPR